MIDGLDRKNSTLRRAVKVLGSALIGALVAPTAVLTAQPLRDEPTTLTDSLPATELHGEPRHTVGGLQQARDITVAQVRTADYDFLRRTQMFQMSSHKVYAVEQR